MKPIVRYALSISLAAAVSTALVVMMTHLIAPDAVASTSAATQSVRFQAIRPPEPVNDKTRRPTPPDPPKPIELPDRPVQPVSAAPTPSFRTLSSPDSVSDLLASIPRELPGTMDGGNTVGSAGGDGLLYGVPPQYPAEALQRGIQGQVVVSVTVGPDGRVVQVEIVESNPPRTFDRSAAKAAAKWRFSVSEKPLRVFQRSVVFSLDKA